MNSVKKFIRSTVLAIAAFCVLALPTTTVLAQAVIDPELCRTNSDATLCKENKDTQTTNKIYGPDGIITKAVQLLSLVIGVAAVLMIMIGGFKYVLAAGDSNSINSAKNTILYALIGLLIAATAQAIIVFVIKRL